MYGKYLSRKERIMITAIDLFDEAGINGLTTKEIARRQNITEPAIYKHFSSKKEIVREILNRYAQFDSLIQNTLQENQMAGKLAILYLVKSYAEYYQNYPSLVAVLFSFDLFRYDAELKEFMNQVIGKRRSLLRRLAMQSIANKELPFPSDAQSAADLFFGMIFSTTFIWKLEGCQFDLKERILEEVSMLFQEKASGTSKK